MLVMWFFPVVSLIYNSNPFSPYGNNNTYINGSYAPFNSSILLTTLSCFVIKIFLDVTFSNPSPGITTAISEDVGLLYLRKYRLCKSLLMIICISHWFKFMELAAVLNNLEYGLH